MKYKTLQGKSWIKIQRIELTNGLTIKIFTATSNSDGQQRPRPLISHKQKKLKTIKTIFLRIFLRI